MLRIVLVEERARPVVDGLAGDRRVVGVHHAVHEADAEPARDERRLRVDDALEQRERVVAAARRVGVVARERVRGERRQRFAVVARGEELERADADVARGHAREHRARQHLLAHDALARRHGGERARGRDAERGHRLAHDVLAQHGAERGASVAAARERRAPRALELDVASLAVLADDLAEQDRAPVAELRHEAAELVPGVRERDRLRALGQRVAGEHLRALGRSELRPRSSAEQLGERAVDLHDARRRAPSSGATRA